MPVITFAASCFRQTRYPPSYQFAKYTDWIKPYLLSQKADMERTNSYHYYRQRYDTILKSLTLIDEFEKQAPKFHEENKVAYLARHPAPPTELEDWLCHTNDEVLPHYPPQLIIGKEIEEKETQAIGCFINFSELNQ